jgi:hypothetical protein
LFFIFSYDGGEDGYGGGVGVLSGDDSVSAQGVDGFHGSVGILLLLLCKTPIQQTYFPF